MANEELINVAQDVVSHTSNKTKGVFAGIAIALTTIGAYKATKAHGARLERRRTRLAKENNAPTNDPVIIDAQSR